MVSALGVDWGHDRAELSAPILGLLDHFFEISACEHASVVESLDKVGEKVVGRLGVIVLGDKGFVCEIIDQFVEGNRLVLVLTEDHLGEGSV